MYRHRTAYPAIFTRQLTYIHFVTKSPCVFFETFDIKMFNIRSCISFHLFFNSCCWLFFIQSVHSRLSFPNFRLCIYILWTPFMTEMEFKAKVNKQITRWITIDHSVSLSRMGTRLSFALISRSLKGSWTCRRETTTRGNIPMDVFDRSVSGREVCAIATYRLSW